MSFVHNRVMYGRKIIQHCNVFMDVRHRKVDWRNFLTTINELIIKETFNPSRITVYAAVFSTLLLSFSNTNVKIRRSSILKIQKEHGVPSRKRCFKADSIVQKGCQRITMALRYLVPEEETKKIDNEFIPLTVHSD